MVSFRRAFLVWEIPVIAALLGKLEAYQIDPNQEDSRFWALTKNGSYSVRTGYEHFDTSPAMIIPWKDIWFSAMLMKVQLFLWIGTLGKMWTIDKEKGSLPNKCVLLMCQGWRVNCSMCFFITLMLGKFEMRELETPVCLGCLRQTYPACFKVGEPVPLAQKEEQDGG